MEENGCGRGLGTIEIRRNCYLSTLISIICVIRLRIILKKTEHDYVFQGRQQNSHHLSFTDDFQLCGKAESQASSSVDMMYAFNVDIKMELGLKSRVLVWRELKAKIWIGYQ